MVSTLKVYNNFETTILFDEIIYILKVVIVFDFKFSVFLNKFVKNVHL